MCVVPHALLFKSLCARPPGHPFPPSSAPFSSRHPRSPISFLSCRSTGPKVVPDLHTPSPNYLRHRAAKFGMLPPRAWSQVLPVLLRSRLTPSQRASPSFIPFCTYFSLVVLLPARFKKLDPPLVSRLTHPPISSVSDLPLFGSYPLFLVDEHVLSPACHFLLTFHFTLSSSSSQSFVEIPDSCIVDSGAHLYVLDFLVGQGIQAWAPFLFILPYYFAA